MTDSPLPCTDRPELFFAERPDQISEAKRLCAACPEQPACLAGALERREPCGVWGGRLFIAGLPVPWRRPRSRPTNEQRQAYTEALEAMREA